MIAAFKLDDLVPAGIAAGKSNSAHGGLSARVNHPHQIHAGHDVADALGRGLFSVVGATLALEAGTSLFVASLLGVVTGTFGGVIGDIVCNKVPSLFRTAPLYATCSFAGCWLLFALQWFQVPAEPAVSIALAFIVLLRLLAIRFRWRLPQFDYPDADNTPAS